MAIILKADARSLTKGAKYSFLTNNYASGVSAVVVDNGTNFAANDYILLGNFGQESTEIIKINTVSSNTLNLATTTSFSHAESTKATVIPYNQVIFYYTTTATFSAGTVLTTTNIQPDSNFTITSDATNTTGFGWYKFYNSTTDKASTNSNAIPYSDFAENSVKKILDSFFSLLNQKELKLISNTEAFAWLNSGYSHAQTSLNLINDEYTVASDNSISVTSGTKEYSLPTGFYSVISLYNDTDNEEINSIDLEDVSDWDSSSANTIKYYLRGSYIGFSPTPTSAFTAVLKYKSNITTLTSYYDNVTLPQNGHYILIDYLMFRACQKLQNGREGSYWTLFTNAIERMKFNSHKRTNTKEMWDIIDEANV